MWDWEETLLDLSVGGGSALSSKILDFEKTYFCRLFSAKIYLYNQNSGGSSYGRSGRPPPINQNLGLAMAARLRHGGKFSLKSLTFGHFFV